MTIDHFGFGVADYARAKAFYVAALAPLVITLVTEVRPEQTPGNVTACGFGKGGKPEPDPAFAPFLEKDRTGDRRPSDEEITDRLILPMLLEATRVLEEGIVREPADVDMGLILGIGFPPYRGGILRWSDSVGADKLVDRLATYAHLGKRFEPTETLTRMARSGAKFYPIPKLAMAMPAGEAVPSKKG